MQSDSGDVCSTHSWVYNKIGAYGDVKTVYHGRQYKISSRKVIFYPDKYLSANGLVEIFPDGTKEYNILDNMNSTRMKIKDNDTSLTFADYEPYGENQHHSIDDIPKRGYMGSHKSKENGYMQMGARLYNAETGRVMSVDPLMEIFTGHSPYHYSYNNPVMFSDPSGLAPEGEKNNTVQAGGSDIISSGYTGGFWAEKTISVYEGSFKSPLGLDNPLAPAKRIKYNMYGSETSYVWIGGSSGAGGGGGGMATPKSGEGASSSQNSSKKTYNNTTSKSVRDQVYNEVSFGNQSGSFVADETSVCAECGNNNYSSDVSLKNYFDYDGDGEISWVEGTLGVVELLGWGYDILTIPSGEGVVIASSIKLLVIKINREGAKKAVKKFILKGGKKILKKGTDDIVDISKFSRKGTYGKKWKIVEDYAKDKPTAHGGSYYKLLYKGNHVATLDKFGKILR